jgi:hypothetical protein
MFGYVKGIISWTSTTPSPSELVEAEKQQLIRENAIRERVREQINQHLQARLAERLPRTQRAKAGFVGGSRLPTAPVRHHHYIPWQGNSPLLPPTTLLLPRGPPLPVTLLSPTIPASLGTESIACRPRRGRSILWQ